MLTPFLTGVHGVDHNHYFSYQIIQTGIGDVETKMVNVKEILTVT
ncbi:MAG: hypothetical protein ACTS78_00625 [Arsenophonus sp. NC-WZS1-MAG3]